MGNGYSSRGGGGTLPLSSSTKGLKDYRLRHRQIHWSEDEPDTTPVCPIRVRGVPGLRSASLFLGLFRSGVGTSPADGRGEAREGSREDHGPESPLGRPIKTSGPERVRGLGGWYPRRR